MAPSGSEGSLSDVTDELSAIPPPRSEQRPVIGLDVGGTKIAGGVVTGDGRVLQRMRVPTPTDDGSATVDAMAAVVDQLRASHPEVERLGWAPPAWSSGRRAGSCGHPTTPTATSPAPPAP